MLVARPDGTDRTRRTSINACLPPAVAFDGQRVATSEGLGTAPGPRGPGQLHPVQQEMAAPVLLSLGASVVLASRDAEREVPLDEYYTGYRQSVRRPDEIIRAIRSGASPAAWPMMRGRQRLRRTW